MRWQHPEPLLRAVSTPKSAMLWTGAFVSNIGTWIKTVGVGILVTARTGNSGWTVLAAAAGFLPSGLVSRFGGVLADWLSRPPLLLGTTFTETLLPDLVPEEDLVGEVALSSAQWNLGRVIGPALAGGVIGIGGYAWAFGSNALSCFAVIAVVAGLQLPPPAPHDRTSLLARSETASCTRAVTRGYESSSATCCATPSSPRRSSG